MKWRAKIKQHILHISVSEQVKILGMWITIAIYDITSNNIDSELIHEQSYKIAEKIVKKHGFGNTDIIRVN